MANITAGQLKKLRTRARSAAGATKFGRVKLGKFAFNAVTAAETTGAAYGFGYLQTRFATPLKIAGMPAGAAAAAGLYLLAVLGVGMGMENHLKAMADGALASWAVAAGRGLGITQKAKVITAGGQQVLGMAPGYELLGWEEQLADLANV